MVRLVVFLVVVVGGFITWQVRRAIARQRLREIDAGLRCIACDQKDMSSDGDVVRCQRCGHSVDLKQFQAVALNDREIDAMTRPS